MTSQDYMPKSECNLIHKALDEKVGVQERRISAHSERIDVLEQHDAENRNEIKHLVESIDKLAQSNEKLVTNIKWLVGVILTVSGIVCSILALLK